MALLQTELKNMGMSRDLSISSETNNYAFENHNIRIQATDDSTVLAVTNLQGPKKVTEKPINGILVGKCKCPDFLVLFTHDNDVDYIYRIDFYDPYDKNPSVKVLYKGNLNFKTDAPIEALYYLENVNVQKVYFTDGVNTPRFINIITPAERTGTMYKDFQTYSADQGEKFEFFPVIHNIPKFSIQKDYSGTSEHPAGTIQYFASYYNTNGAETLIANASSIFTIDYANRGGTAEENGCCNFKIELTNLDKTFDYVRVYSATRTSQEGDVVARIVGSYSIKEDTKKITIVDNAINQETIEANQLFFIGGTPFIAGTLAYKDGTLFFGNLKTSELDIPKELEDALQKTIAHVTDKVRKSSDILDEHYWSTNVEFVRQGYNDTTTRATNIKENNYKTFSFMPTKYGTQYKYRRQTDNSSISYKTFKGGEIYRFGIQFQDAKGQWTSVAWIGDKKCESYPYIDTANNAMMLNNAVYKFPPELKAMCELLGFKNYRIVIADPETQNGRSILSQGLVCPTMFTPGQRAMNSPYSLSSWIMRPREGKVASHHFEPLQAAEEEEGAELWSYQLFDNKLDLIGPEDNEYTKPYILSKDSEPDTPSYLVTVLAVDSRRVAIKMTKVWSNDIDNNFASYEKVQDVLNGYYHNAAGKTGRSKTLKALYKDIYAACDKYGISTECIPSKSAMNTLMQKITKTKLKKAFAWLGAIVVIIAAILIAVFSAGTATALSAAMIHAAVSILSVVATTAASTMIASGVEAVKDLKNDYGLNAQQIKEMAESYTALESWQKEFILNGYWVFGQQKTAIFTGGDTEIKGMPVVFKPTAEKAFDKYFNDGAHQDARFLMSVLSLKKASFNDRLIKKQRNEFYIDESIVTFHAPYLDQNNLNYTNAKFRVVGIAPVDNNYGNFDIKITDPYLTEESAAYGTISKYRNTNTDLLVSDYLYTGPDYKHDQSTITNWLTTSYADYKVFMFDKSGSLIGADSNTQIDEDKKVSTAPCVIQDKTFYNHQFALQTVYLDSKNFVKYSPSELRYFSGDNDAVQFVAANKARLYYGNYDYLITENKKHLNEKGEEESGLKNFYKTGEDTYNDPYVNAQVRMQYKSTPHVMFDLSNSLPGNKSILPYFENREVYEGLTTRKETLGEGWCSENTIEDSQTITDCWTEDDEWYYKDAYFIPATNISFTVPGIGKVITSNYVYCRNTGTIVGNDRNICTAITNAYNRISEIDAELSSLTEEYNKLDTEANNLINNINRLTNTETKLNDQKDTLTSETTGIKDKTGQQTLQQGYTLILESLDKTTGEKYRFELKLNEILARQREISASKSALEKEKENLQTAIERYEKEVEITKEFTVDEFITMILGESEKFFANSYLRRGKPIIVGLYAGGDPAVALMTGKYVYSDSDTPYTKLKILKSGSTILATQESNYQYSNLYSEEMTGSDDQVYILKGELTDHRYTFTHKNGLCRYKEFPIRYNVPKIKQDVTICTESGAVLPYLFVGELYKEIKHKDLYGGFDNAQIKNLTWLPASAVTPIGENVHNMEGDTYFQRWDCLKTYPTTTENFGNKVVDITSFMVESHYNLDGRTDKNRGTYNMVVNPTNFNLFNTAYNFKNDLFSYSTKQNDLGSKDYPNQFTWSLVKNQLADVDSWTGISMSSLAQCSYPITKLVLFNDNLIAITEHSIELIKFNLDKLLAAQDNTFIQLQNSNKVEGVKMFSEPYGSFNKTVLVTDKGLYIIDDNEKSFVVLGGNEKESPNKAILKMDSWFKENVSKGTYSYSRPSPFHLEYDPIHKDVYIINGSNCLIYNELLSAFTSFMSLEETYTLFTYGGKLYSVGHIKNPSIYRMYAGEFNTTYDGKVVNYSMEYRANPAPIGDKTFTNVEFVADTQVDPANSSKSSIPPINFIRAWTEYQDTLIKPLEFKRDYPSSLKQKFRIWRGDIPRDAGSKWKRDRIRNPWIHLTLGRDNIKDNNKTKMEFHKLSVQYLS